MKTAISRKTISELVNQLQAYHPEKIILFGSASRGGPARDIDLLVIKKTGKSYFDRLREINRLYLNRWNSEVTVDLTVYTPEEFAVAKKQKRVFIDQVERYGQVVYQKDL